MEEFENKLQDLASSFRTNSEALEVIVANFEEKKTKMDRELVKLNLNLRHTTSIP